MSNILIGDYVKNIWYNLITIVIIAATMIVSTIYISNITAQTRLYNLISPYLNEQSLFMAIKWDFDETNLSKVEGSLMTKELVCYSNHIQNLRHFGVYSEEMMNNFKPRLVAGRYIDDGNNGEIEVLAADAGFEVGDVLTVSLFANDTGEELKVKVRVVGIIADGQKLFMTSGKGGTEISYDDIYLTYSYDQLKEIALITTEKQLGKIGTTVAYMNYCCLYKLQDSITDEERNENQLTITNYEMENGYMPTASSYPSPAKLTSNMQSVYDNILLKYVPLTIGLIILVVVCVIGIIAIKTARSTKYYAILHICGMNSRKTIAISGVEMTINCVLATMIAISLVVIQNEFKFFGMINCEIGVVQLLTMLTISGIVILITMLVTGTIMKENTPMEILRDTAY